jgi:hypothetical protein
MADDALRQVYGLPGVAAVRQGYVFARNRQRKKQEKKREKGFPEEYEKAVSEEEGTERKHIDIRV